MLIAHGDIDRKVGASNGGRLQNLLQDRLNLVKQNAVPYKPHALDKEWENMRKANYEDFEQSPETKVTKKALMK